MSPKGVMTREKASHDPGLSPIKGNKFCPGTQTRSRDKHVSLPLGISGYPNPDLAHFRKNHPKKERQYVIFLLRHVITATFLAAGKSTDLNKPAAFRSR